MKTLIIIVFCMLINNSCKKDIFPEDDKLHTKRQDYTGTQIRLDGYYYRVNYEDKIFDGYFFYRNGIAVSLGGVRETLFEYDQYIESLKQNQYYKNQKSAWGVFTMHNNSILFERWYPAQPFEAHVSEGVVLNDTTFRIHISYRMVNGEKTEVREKEDTYYFREFSPKPDSTNTFIK